MIFSGRGLRSGYIHALSLSKQLFKVVCPVCTGRNSTAWLSVFLLLVSWSSLATAQISSTVRDAQNQVLPGATVLLLPDSVFTATDIDGRFSFKSAKPGQHALEVSFVGYKTQKTALFSWPDESVPTIVLDVETSLLESLVIREDHDHLEDDLSTSHLGQEWLQQSDRSSFAAALEREPGIAVIRTGVGIAKPVIRGLSSQRVIVQDQGIKQEGQQWGADHGLEIDPFAVERVEIIKGPASLIYGSDGLGGVIRILPPAIPAEGQIKGGFETLYRSVNQHIGGTAFLGMRKNGFVVQGRYSYQNFGDYAVPADSFIFQGFELPITDGLLKNTAGRESSAQLILGKVGLHSTSRLALSRYKLQVGLFSGAVGIPRSYALEPDGNRRDIDFPSQAVEHWKLAWNQMINFGSNLLSFDVGVQRNLRQEFSFPEFHSLPNADPNNTLALQFELWTYSINAHYDQQLGKGWTGTYGADLQSQMNRVAGFETLLPDFELVRGGVYALAFRNLKRNNRLSFGGRLDAGSNQSDAQKRYVYAFSGEISDSLSTDALKASFGNYSFGIGYNREWIPLGMLFRIHGGKSFRVPHPSEMVSNGVHHGTFRHEMGNPDLKSEHGYQLDAGLEWEREHVFASLSGYFNFFKNYIYLTPSGQLSPLPEAGQIFEYRQNDAIYTGFELQTYWQPNEVVLGELSAEYLYNYNLQTTLPLPFTPPASIRQSWRFSKAGRGKWGTSYVSIGGRYRFAQNRTDRNELKTPDNFVLEASVGTRFTVGKQALELQLQGYNLLNSAYLDHLSRYRLIGIPEPGRNIVVSLRVPLEFDLGT